jgi:zinc protease
MAIESVLRNFGGISRRLLRQKYASSVRALTADQLNAAAKRVVHPDEVIWIVVGDLKKVEAGIRELNLGEVVRYTGEM